MKKITLIDKAFYLKKTPLFRGLDLDYLLPIADKLGISEFHPGDTIFEENEPAHLMYFLLKGSVTISQKKMPPLTLKEGDYFGDEALFNGLKRDYSALASSPVFTLTLTKPHLHTIIAECPAVAMEFLFVYTKASPFMRSAHNHSQRDL